MPSMRREEEGKVLGGRWSQGPPASRKGTDRAVGTERSGERTRGSTNRNRIRELFLHVARIGVSEAPSNLFGRTPLAQGGADILPESWIQQRARSSWLTGPSRFQPLRGAGPIRAVSRVARVFAGHGAGARRNIVAIVRNE